MSQHSALTNTNAQVNGDGSTTLHGRWRLVAQVAWVVLALLTVGVFVAGIPATFALLRTPCTGDQCLTLGMLSPDGMQRLAALGIAPDVYARSYVAFNIVTALVWWVLGGVIVWRRSNDWMALLVALMLLLQGGNFVTGFLDTISVLARLLDFLSWTTLALVFYLFPDGRFTPRWMRWLALLTIVLDVWYYFLPEYNVMWLSNDPGSLSWFLLICSLVWTQVYRYRNVSGPVQRQQTKWVVFGFATFYIGVALLALPIPFFGAFDAWGQFILAITIPLLRLLIPISIGFAILHSRLWDIDLLINRALVYGTLTSILAAIYVGTVVLLQQVFAPLIGAMDDFSIIASTLAIAALFNPLRRRIQHVIDRRFYRRKYDAQKTLQSFSARLREDTDLAHLSNDVIAVVQETLQPAHVSLWLCDGTREAVKR
jgi:hypothetical protein